MGGGGKCAGRRDGRDNGHGTTERCPRRPAGPPGDVQGGAHLVVPVVGGIVQGGVVIQALGVHFRPRGQQLLGDVVVAAVTRLMQRCPAWKQTLRTYVI